MRADWNDCLNLNCFSSEPGEPFQTNGPSEGPVAESVFIAGMFVKYGREFQTICKKYGHTEEALQAKDAVDAMYQAVLVHAGDTVAFGVATGGARAYIAFAGGLDVPVVMGSKATLMRNKIGGVEGRKLEKGDAIGFVNPKTSLPKMEMRKLEPEKFPQKEVTLRVVTGPQDTAFSEEEVRKFFWYSATITNEFDRMGCRLEREEPLHHIKDGNTISDGIVFGSIQVPTNGQPIIMLADRQTTGGYTKIGTVISVDLPKLAQSVPGYKVHFVRVGIQLAQELYLRQQKELKNLERCLGQRS